MRRALAAGVAVAAAAGAVGLALAVLHARTAPAAAATAVPIGTARVTRTDIVSQQRVNGTLGYGGTTTIDAPAGTSPAQVLQAQASAAADQAALNAAVQADADTAAAGQLAVSQAEAAVAAATGQPALAQAQAQLASAQQHAQQSQHQADAQEASARVALQNAQAALQAAQVDARLGGSFTWLPAPGTAIQQGQQLYAVDGYPVVLLYGAEPAYRQLCAGVSGEDVRQLERDLVALGFATSSNLAADGSFTAADAAAVGRWQASLGLPRTGAVRLGEAVFAPGPVRVAAVRATLGAPEGPGAPVLDVTATGHSVEAQLDAASQQLVHPGDHVSVLMPDGHSTVAGTVTAVSRVATQAPGQGQGQGQGQGGTNQQASVSVSIALADESAAGTLDQAPVYVSITRAAAHDVLAVPVTALLAQPDGGYAVAVRTGGSRRLVIVQPGLYGDGGLVQVTGDGLAAGDVVEVPAQ